MLRAFARNALPRCPMRSFRWKLEFCNLISKPPRRLRLMHAAAQQKLLADVDAFCEEIRPIEELCYVEHRFNDQVLPLARNHNILGIPVQEAYGGRGADTVTYARALARIGRE